MGRVIRRALGLLGTAMAIVMAMMGQVVAPAAAVEPDHLLLARICVHEAGFESERDCAAIHAVLRRVAQRSGRSYRAAAYAYSGRALRGETSRPWVADLGLDGAAPRGWRDGPRGPSWERRREAWARLLEASERILAGETAHTCESDPDDWGGRIDRHRARRLGLVRLDCGETRNDFYRRP